MKTQVNEDLIAPLPAPVQRSLRRSGVVGREIPRSVVVRQKGRLRSAPHSNWLAFTASETYDVAEPGFEWRAALKKGPVTVGRATDSLHAARGKMNVKLLGLLTVLDLTGPELDQGTLLRWLNETRETAPCFVVVR